jgi:hypothetical protein
MIVLVMFSHHLTSIFFVATMLLWTALSLLTKQRIRELILLSIVSLVVFISYRVVVPSQYILSNPNATYKLAMNYSKFLWVFKDIVVFAVTALCATYGCYSIYKNKPIYSFMVISLIVSAFVLTYGLPMMGIHLDQARFLLFSIVGFIIGVSVLVREVVFPKKEVSPSFITKTKSKSLAIIIGVAALIAINGYIGIVTSWEINSFTRASAVGITSPKGDNDLQGLVDWVKNNTKEKDVFVAEQYLSKIIMGLGERRVLENDDPAYMFMQGESERAIAADSLLHSNYEVYNQLVRIRDQYPVQNFNPMIGLWQQGNYRDIIYFADAFWQATVDKGGNYYNVSPFNLKTSAQVEPLSVSYETPDVIFRRDLKIEEDGVRVIFSAEPRETNIKLSEMKVYGWRPWANNNLTNILFNGSRLILVDGQVDANIEVKNYDNLNYYLNDPLYKQSGFWATFKPKEGNITAEFFIQYKNPSKDTSMTSDAKDLFQKYGISYFAILNKAKDEILFLEADGHPKVYGNNLVSVYQVKH